jgi:hypothetical protein
LGTYINNKAAYALVNCKVAFFYAEFIVKIAVI